jgi:hypothetical protein
METFMETPAACILCILGLPSSAVVSLRRQIGQGGQHAYS